MKHWLKLQVGALALLSSGAAAAQCDGGNRTATLSLPTTVTASNDASPGTLLSPWVVSAEISNYFSCWADFANGMGGDTRFLTDSTVRVAFHTGAQPDIIVWNTNLAGVGVALVHRWFNGPCGWSGWTGGSSNTIVGGACASAPPTDVGSQVFVALVKTGPITAGLLSAMTVMQGVPLGADEDHTHILPISPARISFVTNPVAIVTPTCTVTTQNVAVRMTSTGSLSTTAFTGRYSTSNPVAFKLQLRCSGTPARLGITFSDIRNPGNRSNILSLSAHSSATGLGVQILHNNAPVRYGRDSSAPGNQGQIVLNVHQGGESVIDLPFTARYIQTAYAVVPGRADAAASFTMSYH